MKKLTGILLIAASLMLTCCHEHIWTDATCTQPMTCEECGETQGELLEHTWIEADCTHPKYCEVCEKTVGTAQPHVWLSATCETPKTCINCKTTEGEPRDHNFLPATYDEPSTCSNCNMTVGEKLKPASEWGFYDLDKMEYSLVCINSYNLSDKSNPYVTFTGRVYKFENGYKLNWNVSIENGKCIFGSTGNPEKYEIASNDSLVLNGGWDDLTIDERKTISSMPNFVVFVENTGPSSLYATYWYIPYSLIDWNRPIEIDPDSENKNEYRLYLKTN